MDSCDTAYPLKFLAYVAGLFILSTHLHAEPIWQYENQIIQQLNAQKKTSQKPSSKTWQVENLHIKNSSPEKIKRVLLSIWPNLKIGTHPRSRTLSFLTSPQTAKKIKKLVQDLDTPLPLIQIKVSILEISYTHLEQYQQLFTNLTDIFKINYDFTTRSIIPATSINLAINNLVKTGHAKLLAQPIITTLDNQKATIEIGDQIPYTTTIFQNQLTTTQIHYQKTGIQLEITPKISSKNIITAKISSKISTIKLWKQFENSKYPILSTKEAHTTVRIQNQKLLIIAGLFDQQTKTNQTKIPLLGDIPLLGELFKGTTTEKINTDIIFLIEPKIL